MEKTLDVSRSLDLLKRAAREHRFVSYGDLATASGLTWSYTIRARMSRSKGHLDCLLDICHGQGLPLLTALCVNKKNLETGELSEFSLSGFADGARRLGYTIQDEKTFFKRCQRESFEWGRTRS